MMVPNFCVGLSAVVFNLCLCTVLLFSGQMILFGLFSFIKVYARLSVGSF